MSVMEHGGPAFPVSGNQTSRPEASAFGMAGHTGMSLRQWFAGKISPAIYQGGVQTKVGESYRDAVIRESFEFADAMLRASNEPALPQQPRAEPEVPF